VHVDVKYLPQMADEDRRTYLFVAIDRASRWVYLERLTDKSAKSAQGFFKRLLKAAPFKIYTVLTDNGKEFTDRFCATGEREPTGRHPLDRVCSEQAIEHRLMLKTSLVARLQTATWSCGPNRTCRIQIQ
jgi:transposase-like protein